MNTANSTSRQRLPLRRVLSCSASFFALGAALATASPAWAESVGPDPQYCLDGGDAGALLNCTANDVRIAKATNPQPSTCTAGETFNLTADFQIVANSKKGSLTRYDIGAFFETAEGQNDNDGARHGICALVSLDPAATLNLDGDACGDVFGTVTTTLTIEGVQCVDNDGDHNLDLPYCTSWKQPGANDLCGGPEDTFPGTSSKCSCDDTFEVPVTVEAAEITVTKTANPTTIAESGGVVTYTVKVKNEGDFESVTLNTMEDSLYGDLFSESNTAVFDNECQFLKGTVLPANTESVPCTFKVNESGEAGDEITDIVEVCGTQGNSGTSVCDDDDATVTITDVASTPTVTKTAGSPTCYVEVDVPYTVVVNNPSAVDDLTVNGLNDDKFGDITTTHDAVEGQIEEVVSTTCGDATGYVIEPGGNYSCSFVGRIVSNNCDGAHSNVVTADVTDDDGNSSLPTDDAQVSW